VLAATIVTRPACQTGGSGLPPVTPTPYGKRKLRQVLGEVRSTVAGQCRQ
jgi:hypothetical protein